MAFAVHFLVLPITARDLVTLVLNQYLHFLKGVLDAQAQFIKSIPARDWGGQVVNGSFESNSENSNPDVRVTAWPEAEKWRAATTAATECQVKIHAEMRYVKREFVYSKLAATDFVCVTKLLRNILIPIVGLESVIQVADRVEKHGGWGSMKVAKDGSGSTASDQHPTDEVEKERWIWLFGQLSGPYQQLWQAMIEGLDYAFFTLGFTKKPAFYSKAEFEAKAAGSSEGKGFSKYVENTIRNFLEARETPLKEWCQLSGMDDLGEQETRKDSRYRHQAQLYLVLDVSSLNLQMPFLLNPL